MNMKKTVLLLSALALVACNGDKDDDNALLPSVPQPQRVLTVRVNENPLQAEDATRAAYITTSSLKAFTLHYQDLYAPSFTKDAGTWSTATWPTVGDDEKIDFYARNGGTFVWNGGAPYVSFTMEEQASEQKDLLVATHKDIAYEDNTGQVSLTFDHACAAVQFYVYKEEADDYVVQSVVLSNVANSGSYRYEGGWTDVSGTAYYTLTDGAIVPTATPTLLPCEWMFFIPQEKSAVNIEVTYTKNGGSPTVKTLHMESGMWQAGYQYTVNIKIGR